MCGLEWHAATSRSQCLRPPVPAAGARARDPHPSVRLPPSSLLILFPTMEISRCSFFSWTVNAFEGLLGCSGRPESKIEDGSEDPSVVEEESVKDDEATEAA